MEQVVEPRTWLRYWRIPLSDELPVR